MQVLGQLCDQIGGVLMEQLMSANADGGKERGLEEFIGCDEQQAFVV
jgi:hypothetical protein